MLDKAWLNWTGITMLLFQYSASTGNSESMRFPVT